MLRRSSSLHLERSSEHADHLDSAAYRREFAEHHALASNIQPVRLSSVVGFFDGLSELLGSAHAGSKHAVGYFLKDDGACQLVVMAADDANYAPTRFEAAITDGASTAYEFAGKSLEFGCRDHAQLMTVNTLEAVATNANACLAFLPPVPPPNWGRSGAPIFVLTHRRGRDPEVRAGTAHSTFLFPLPTRGNGIFNT